MASALTLYCGRLFSHSLSLFDFGDPRAAGFLLAGFIWGFRLLSAVGRWFRRRLLGLASWADLD